jgi:uncharacterized protein
MLIIRPASNTLEISSSIFLPEARELRYPSVIGGSNMLKPTLFLAALFAATFTMFMPAIGVDLATAKDAGTALLDAARDGDMALAEKLIDKGVNINVQDAKGWTPLMFAVSSADTKLIKLLLAKGADANVATNKGWTPLMKACVHNHVDTMELLMHRGADLNAKNAEGKTALILAIDKGHKDVVKVLISHGAKE